MKGILNNWSTKFTFGRGVITMKNKILVLIAVVASAGLIMAWGCGGKATLDGGTAYGDVDSVPITISGGAGALDVLTSSTKNIPIEPGGGRLDFGAESIGGSGSITGCDIVPSALSHNSVPVIPKVSGDPKADCDAAGKDPLNCITWEVTHPVSAKFALIQLRGNMHDIPLSDTDYILMRLKCSVHVDVDDLSLEPLADTRSTSRLVEFMTVDYIANGSPDFAIEKPDFDFLDMTIVDDDTNGNSGWDTTVATGCKGGVYPTCDFSADAVRDLKPAQFLPTTFNDFRKVISFSAKGSGGTQVIDFDRYIEMMVTTNGVTSGSLDKVFDNTYVSYLFCDNVDVECALTATHYDLAAFSSLSSGGGGVVEDGDVDPTEVTLTLTPGLSYTDGTANATNITLAGTGLPAGMPATVSTLTLPPNSGIANIGVANAWAYEKQQFVYEIKGIKAIDGGGNVSIQKDPVSLNLVAMPSASTAMFADHFGLDSDEIFNYPGLAQDEFAPAAALDSAAEANAAVLEWDGVNFLERVIGTGAGMAAGNLVMTIAEMAVDQFPIQLSIKVDDLATYGIGDKILVRAADKVSNDYYAFGLEVRDVASAAHVMVVGLKKEWDTDHWVEVDGAKFDLTAANLSDAHPREIKLIIDDQNGIEVSYLGDDDKWARLLSSFGCGAGATGYFNVNDDCIIPYSAMSGYTVSTIVVFKADSTLDFDLLQKRAMNLTKTGYIADIVESGPPN